MTMAITDVQVRIYPGHFDYYYYYFISIVIVMAVAKLLSAKLKSVMEFTVIASITIASVVSDPL